MASSDKHVLQTAGGETLVSSDKLADELFQNAQTLDLVSAEDAPKHEAVFKAILKASQASELAKKMGAQFIPKYFKLFPASQNDALSAQLDLCEDESREVRVKAIQGLPQICKDTLRFVNTISNVLAQLVLYPPRDDEAKPHEKINLRLELEAIRKSFVEVFVIDPKTTLASFFRVFSQAPKDQDQKKSTDTALIFFRDGIVPKLKSLAQPVQGEVEQVIDAKFGAMLANAPESEFKLYFDIIKGLSHMEGDDGVNKKLEIISEWCGVAKLGELKPATDIDALKRVLTSIDMGLAFFGTKSPFTALFFNYLVTKVLPAIDQMQDADRLQVLRHLADISPLVGTTDARNALPTIYANLRKLLPEEPKNGDNVDINLSYVECMLFSFHQLASKAPGALNPICGIKKFTGQPQDSDWSDHSDKLKDFQGRLSYLEKKCREFKELFDKAGSSKPVKNRLVSSIIKLSQSLKGNPITFVKKDDVYLSWAKTVGGNKRSAEPLADEPTGKRQKNELYRPPSQRGENKDGSGTRGRGGFRRGRGGRGFRRGGRGRGSKRE